MASPTSCIPEPTQGSLSPSGPRGHLQEGSLCDSDGLGLPLPTDELCLGLHPLPAVLLGQQRNTVRPLLPIFITAGADARRSPKPSSPCQRPRTQAAQEQSWDITLAGSIWNGTKEACSIAPPVSSAACLASHANGVKSSSCFSLKILLFVRTCRTDGG